MWMWHKIKWHHDVKKNQNSIMNVDGLCVYVCVCGGVSVCADRHRYIVVVVENLLLSKKNTIWSKIVSRILVLCENMKIWKFETPIITGKNTKKNDLENLFTFGICIEFRYCLLCILCELVDEKWIIFWEKRQKKNTRKFHLDKIILRIDNSPI